MVAHGGKFGFVVRVVEFEILELVTMQAGNAFVPVFAEYQRVAGRVRPDPLAGANGGMGFGVYAEVRDGVEESEGEGRRSEQYQRRASGKSDATGKSSGGAPYIGEHLRAEQEQEGRHGYQVAHELDVERARDQEVRDNPTQQQGGDSCIGTADWEGDYQRADGDCGGQDYSGEAVGRNQDGGGQAYANENVAQRPPGPQSANGGVERTSPSDDA